MHAMKSTSMSCAVFLMIGLSFSAQAHDVSSAAITSPVLDQAERDADDADVISSAEFLQKILAHNLAEIDMGQMVMERGDSEDIRDYGRIIARDHLIIDGMVILLAKRLAVELDAEALTGDVATFKQSLVEMNKKLAGASDGEFRAMLRTLAIESHEAAVDLLERAEKGAPDLSVRLLARTSDPVIRRHLKLAKEL